METMLAIDLWLEALVAEGKAASTVANYRHFTRPLPALLPLLDTPNSASALRRWLTEYRKTHAAESARSVFIAWRSLGNWCVGQGMVAVSPMAGMKQPKSGDTVRLAYPPGEIRAIFASLRTDHSPAGLRDLAMLSVLLDCGLRASELCQLELADVADSVLLIRQSKSGRPRAVPMGTKAALALDRYLAHGRPKLRPQSGAVFVTQAGGRLNRNSLYHIMAKRGRAIGLPISLHRWRHSWATSLLRAGVPMETVRRMGGWSGFQMLIRYTHLTVDDLKDAQLRASPLDRLT